MKNTLDKPEYLLPLPRAEFGVKERICNHGPPEGKKWGANPVNFIVSRGLYILAKEKGKPFKIVPLNKAVMFYREKDMGLSDGIALVMIRFLIWYNAIKQINHIKKAV